jgi:hypothetical protein
MLFAYRAKLYDLPRLRARRTWRPYRVSHVAIIHKLNGLRVQQPLDTMCCWQSQARPTRLEERSRIMLAGLCESS